MNELDDIQQTNTKDMNFYQPEQKKTNQINF